MKTNEIGVLVANVRSALCGGGRQTARQLYFRSGAGVLMICATSRQMLLMAEKKKLHLSRSI